jgi:hypothetical protein
LVAYSQPFPFRFWQLVRWNIMTQKVYHICEPLIRVIP